MTDVRISSLPTVVTPTNSDEFPVNQAGITKKVTMSQIASQTGATAHIADPTIHRSINDSATGVTDLWSANKINTQLAGKSDVGHHHDAADITTGTLTVSQGGTGLSTIPAGSLFYAPTLNVLAALGLATSLAISGGNLQVQANTTNQKVAITHNGGAVVGTRKQLNFIDANNIGFNIADNAGGDRLDITPQVATPTLAGDVATKSYVDSLLTFNETRIGKPVYVNATTFTVSFFSLPDSLRNRLISKLASTTVDISTFGLNGIAQSSNLAGTVSVTNGSFTITGTGTAFLTDYIVGDTIAVGSQTARVVAVPSNGSMTVNRSVWTTTSGATYKRGARALYGQYYLYAIDNGTTPGLILSTRNAAGGETLVDFPTGYRPGTDPLATYRQLAYDATLDASANLMNKVVLDGWPYCPRIMYNTFFPGHAGSTSDTNILLFSGVAGSFTDLDASTFIPKNSSMMFLNVGYQNGNGNTALYIRPKNVNAFWEIYPIPSAYQSHDLVPMTHDGNRMLQFMIAASGNASIAIHSYIIDGVPM